MLDTEMHDSVLEGLLRDISNIDSPLHKVQNLRMKKSKKSLKRTQIKPLLSVTGFQSHFNEL